jgi:hypothetical protein
MMDADSIANVAAMLSKGGPAVQLVLVWFGYKAVAAAKKAVEAIENMDRTTTANSAVLTTMAANVASTKETAEAIADKVGA